MTIHLPIGSLKTRSGLEPVPRCEASTYQPTAPSGPVETLCPESISSSTHIVRALTPLGHSVRRSEYKRMRVMFQTTPRVCGVKSVK